MTIPFEQCQGLFTCVHDSEYIKFLLVESYAAEHESVAAEGLKRVDTHTAHHFLDLVIPRVYEVHQALVRDIRIEALNEVCALSCDAPVALAGVAAPAKVAAHRQQSRNTGKCNRAAVAI